MAERPRLTGPELLVAQVGAIDRFRGREVFPEPPSELLEFVERMSEKGFTFEPYLQPGIALSEDAQYPGWHKRPSSYIYDLIRRGQLPPETMRLSLQWGAMETIVRPPYNRGLQLHENDALAPHLEDLRRQGQIEVPDHVKHVPPISRFAVSPREVSGPVAARVAEIGQVDIRNVDVNAPTYAALNYYGNLAHPEFGEANTWEIFADQLRGGDRLVGGDSGVGGLALVDDWDAGDHGDFVAFRLRVGFPSEKS